MTHEIIPYRKLRPSKSSLTIRIIGKNHCSHSDYGLINVWTAIMVLQKVKAFLPCQLQVLSTCFWQRRRVFTRNDLSRSIRDPALRLRTAKLWSRVYTSGKPEVVVWSVNVLHLLVARSIPGKLLNGLPVLKSVRLVIFFTFSVSVIFTKLHILCYKPYTCAHISLLTL